MSENFSQMLIDISDGLLHCATNVNELQSRVDMVVTGWNMSLLSKPDRQLKMKRFLRKLKGSAPSKEVLKEFEGEIKKVIKNKLNLYPNIDTELLRAEVVGHTKGNYEVKAYFKDKKEEAIQQHARQTVTRINQNMAKTQDNS